MARYSGKFMEVETSVETQQVLQETQLFAVAHHLFNLSNIINLINLSNLINLMNHDDTYPPIHHTILTNHHHHYQPL